MYSNLAGVTQQATQLQDNVGSHRHKLGTIL